jgi:hypothetical protein
VARAYTVGTVALALAVPVKWLDNVLSHHTLTGVVRRRQGVSRKVSVEGVMQLALAILLTQDLGLATPDALRFATALSSSGGRHRTPAGIAVDLDLPRFRADLEARLAQAVEITPIPRRGRPSQSVQPSSSKTGRLD